MPQRTKGGLQPTHQPITTVHQPFFARPPTEGTIENVLIDMKKNNRSNYTINFTRKALNLFSRLTSLKEPEAIKMVIADMKDVTNGYKRNLCIAYNKYAKFYGIAWNMPRYKPEAKNISLPSRDKLLMLIANARKNLSIRLQMSMETGMRPVELTRLKVKDIDFDHNKANPITAKNGCARSIPISDNLKTKLQELIIRKNLKPADRLFAKLDAEHYGKQYRQMRNNLAKKLNDPTIQQIRLYDFRHYFCTKKLYEINNPYTVMVLMGHRKLETTQRYMHLMNLNDDEWTVSGATTAQEATKLLEAGFTYQTTIEGIQLFRKRK